MREQMDAMVRLMEGSAKSKPPSGEALVKVAKLAETDDIEGALLTFERQMVAYGVDKSRWAIIMASQLTGKAQKAYMALGNEEAGDYECIKRAILKRYDVSEESHRRKFRDRSKTKEESYSELATSLLDLANRWLEECSSKEEVIEKLATEQFVTKASEDVRVWIREHKPKTCAEAGQWADEFQLARSDSRATAPKPGPRRCHKCNQPGHLAYNFPKAARAEAAHPTDTGARRLTPQQQGASRQFRCFSCRQTEHIARNCPSSAMFCGDVGSTFGVEAGEGVVRQGKVEGVPVEVLLDTGRARTVVRKELVPEGKVFEGKTVVVRGVHGGSVRYPLAELEITVGGRTMVVKAAVSGRLPVQLLLGRDVPELFSLLG